MIRGVGLLSALLLLLATTACTDEVRLAHPQLLWLLWLVPALVLFFVYSHRRRSRLMQRFAAAPMLAPLTSGVHRFRRTSKAVLIVVAVAASLVSLVGFRYGFTWEEVRRRGVDLVVALDVSDSMLVEDAAGEDGLNRLERARRELSDLISILAGDRVALVAFAGIAFLELPLTLDYDAARIFLDALEPDLIPVKGTDLGAALQTSIEAFEEQRSEAERAILLITDGEDHAGEALAMAEEAGERGIRIFAIGIGRDEGSPIPRPGGGFRRDAQGELILSKLDEGTLQQMAVLTGGRYVRSVTGDVDLERIYLEGIKATMEDRELGSTRRRRWKDRFQWLLAIAIAALMIEPLIAERSSLIGGRKERRVA